MKHKYDKIFITNLPSFYKINLYNYIAQKADLLVLFTDDISADRNNDFYHGDKQFDYISLGKLTTFQKCLKILRILSKIKYNSLIVGGWDQFCFWMSIFFSPKNKNRIIVESSYLESATTGMKGFIKKIFLSRISKAYVSGKSQTKLLEDLYFNGDYSLTKGVGIFNIIKQPPVRRVESVGSFLYVGRLSPEKNLMYLINTFNSLPNLKLNIIGFGPQEEELKAIASLNINFLGAIANKELPKYYGENDVFILPSLNEPWGLVIEEALNNGLPVIVSNHVGCADEIIDQERNGLVFKLEEKNGLYNSILKMTDVSFYNKLRENIAKMDFEKIAAHQVNCYID